MTIRNRGDLRFFSGGADVRLKIQQPPDSQSNLQPIFKPNFLFILRSTNFRTNSTFFATDPVHLSDQGGP